ncbi:MAG: ATP-binding cassette domain-containing protein, partial [Vicinamibacterales bacterium]
MAEDVAAEASDSRLTSRNGANRANGAGDNILEVNGLTKHFHVGGGFLSRSSALTIRAVDDVSFSIRRGETFGLVGESGCGKTTLGQTIIRLYNPTSGQIIFNGADISRMGANDLRKHRRAMQMIFQDPSASLDPRMTVGSIIAEPLNIFGIGNREERRERVRELLRVVGLNS